MNSEIKTVAEIFLDKGLTADGFDIFQHDPLTSKTAVRRIGKLLVIDLNTEISYIVSYDELTPFHGSGVDDLNIITSIITLD